MNDPATEAFRERMHQRVAELEKRVRRIEEAIKIDQPPTKKPAVQPGIYDKPNGGERPTRH